MAQLAYSCDTAAHVAPLPVDVLAPTLSIFGHDEAAVAALSADAHGLGLWVQHARPLGSLLSDGNVVLGDVVAVDCASIAGADMAALVRLDERAARSGARLVVFTSLDALDGVFGCLERAATDILADPTPAERVVALGRLMVKPSSNRVRDTDDPQRIALLRLSEEVGRLAAQLDRMALPAPLEGADLSSDRCAAPGRDYQGPLREGERDLLRRPRAPLPDPRLVHRIIRQRRLRERYFERELFADPAWDILLDLTAARAEHRRVSVTSLCIAAAVPPTTALRWIAQMTEMRILVREQDEEDKRRAFVALSDSAADAMARYFDELGKDAAKLI